MKATMAQQTRAGTDRALFERKTPTPRAGRDSWQDPGEQAVVAAVCKKEES